MSDSNLPFIDNRMELSQEEKRLVLTIRKAKKNIIKYGSDIKGGIVECKKIVTQIIHDNDKGQN